MTRLYDEERASPFPHHPSQPTYEDPIQEADWLNEPSTLEGGEAFGFTLFSDDDDWSNPWTGLDN